MVKSDTKVFKEIQNFYFLENLYLRAYLIKKIIASQHKNPVLKNPWRPDFLKFLLAIYTNYLISEEPRTRSPKTTAKLI